MKKSMSVLAGIVALIALFFLVAPRYSANRDALVVTGKTLVDARYNQAVVLEGAKRALTARYNLTVISRSTTYVGEFGAGTRVFREISRIAAEADCECVRLDSVLDLAARSTTKPQRILALAASACSLEGPEAEENWQAEYDILLELAEYPTVEMAVSSRQAQ